MRCVATGSGDRLSEFLGPRSTAHVSGPARTSAPALVSAKTGTIGPLAERIPAKKFIVSVDDSAERLSEVEMMLANPEWLTPAISTRRVILRVICVPARKRTANAWVVLGDTVRRPSGNAVVRELCVTRGDSDFVSEVRDAEVALDVVAGWCREGASFRVPVAGFDAPFGTDGTRYSWSYETGLTTVHLRWWSHGPDDWSELTTWVGDLMARLRVICGGTS